VTVIRLDLAYDGTAFHGWARQSGLRTVQGVLEEAIAHLAGEPRRLTVAGRTDAGAHAAGQVASFVAPPSLDPAKVQRALNAMLGPEIVVHRARRAPDGFDARRSATGRRYVYRIDTARWPNPFEARFAWHRPGGLAVGRMRGAARHLTGEHDFASFCRTPTPPASTVRDLRRLTVSVGAERVEIRAEANAFLHQMVRSLVGTLVTVGEGKRDPDDMPGVLAARRRSAAGPVAPPRGLMLLGVTYGRHPLPDR